MGRSVLVVGGAGYVGSHCARLLEDAGHTVVVLDDLSTGHRAAVRSELHVADLRDREAIRRVLASRRFDAIVHFAGLAVVADSVRGPAHYMDVNVGGTATLAAEAVLAGVPALVFSSSCAVYGAPKYLPVDEAHPTHPVSPYGLSKLLCEQLLHSLERDGLNVCALRYFNAAGAHPSGDLGESHAVETRLIPLALSALQGQRPPLLIYGRDYPTPDGTCVRDYVHVMDLATAHLRALERLWAGGSGGSWNLGTGRGHSVLEVLDSVERVTGSAVPVTDAPRREGDPPLIWATAEAARRDLGWSPELPKIDDIVASAWRWARAPKF